MKKILTYTLITTMISCFSYVSPSFADTQIKNDNVIKLELKKFNLVMNNMGSINNENKNITNDEFNPFPVNFLIPGYTQFYYGETNKGTWFLGGTILSLILPPFLMFTVGRNMELGALVFIYIWLLTPIIYIWSLIDANYMVYQNRLKKVSFKNENLFNVALFSKDF